jgi:structural maintenance of chromosomes protein 6
MEIPLNHHINFITGHNGSGKSAIVAALQICLGASARNTQRGTRYVDFIRRGWTGDAEVSVTLLNAPEGYEYEAYGKAITVTRTLTQHSTSKLQLLSEQGQKISTSIKDVSGPA